MNIRMFFRILTTPSCWVRNYPTDKTVDRFIRTVVAHIDEASDFMCDYYYVYFSFRGKEYGLWTCNRWYAYLMKIKAGDLKDDVYRLAEVSSDALPSREACFLFYDAVGRKVEESRKSGPLKPLLDAIEARNDARG